MIIVTAAEMQDMDAWTIETYGVPGRVLMENAGRGAVAVMCRYFGDLSGRRVGIAAGKGNNGGDGFVMARYLCQQGASVSVFLMADDTSLPPGDALENYRLLASLDIKVYKLVGEESFSACRSALAHQEFWVDALLGTGLASDVRGRYKTMIDHINCSGKPVLAVDLPSGLNADTGRVCGTSIRAHATATFAFAKIGHVVYPGTDLCGAVTVVDIGIPAEVSAAIPANCCLLTAERFCMDREVRPPESHKGKNGHVLVVGGSPGKTGAAAMAANAAMRAGAGLVTLGCPWGLNPVLETQVMEAMTSPLPETADGMLDAAAVSRVLALSEGKQCLALGPGMGTAAETRQFLHQIVAQSRIPMVIDADGINGIAGDPELLARAVAPVILTPHPGEMARLADTDTAAVQADRVAIARRFAMDTGTHLVLKGAATVCAHPDGEVSINPSGNAGMASGGMGDVLTGIVAGFVAQGYAPKTACRMAAYLHGAAGDHLAGSMGPVGYLASDILEVLPTVAVNICTNSSQGRNSWPLKTVENSRLKLPVIEK